MKPATRWPVAFVGAAVVAGCATPGVPAHQASDYLVCSSIFGANVPDHERRTAEVERQRRGLDCGPYVAAMQSNRAYNAASGALLMQQGQQLMRPPVPPGFAPGFAPMPMPSAPRNCTTIPWGNGARTTCY